jgi:signal transduction histidine kinase
VGLKVFRDVGGTGPLSVKNLRNTRDAYLEIATRTTETVQRLDKLLASGEAKDLETVRLKSADFRKWLSGEKEKWTGRKVLIFDPVAMTIDIAASLDEIDHAFADYVGIDLPGNTRGANRTSQTVLGLAIQARARAGAVDSLLASVSKKRRSLLWLDAVVSFALLVGITIWLGMTIYRVWFFPLRLKLIETSAIVERQKKLAHFGELAAGLAHEIRNPLTAINARLFTLEKTIPPGTPEAEDAAVIRNEISRLDRIVKDFLTLARPAEPLLGSLSIRLLVDEVSRLLQPELQNKSISLKVGAITETPFRADSRQLKQVLINLIQNAAEAIQQNGTITVSARTGSRRLHGNPTAVIVIELTDTGPGIPPEVQARLFDPFFSTKESGSGLGLPISARIVDQHGGALEFHTQIGQGTTFEIVLPLQPMTNET